MHKITKRTLSITPKIMAFFLQTFAERTLGRFSLAVPLLVACSTIGALNGALLGGSRMAFAAARDGQFPDIIGTIQVKYLTPWASLWFLVSFFPKLKS